MITGSRMHDEERGHDQEQDREEDLDRRLLRPLLRVAALLALAHLEREVPHDLAGRDAHRLALCDRCAQNMRTPGVSTRCRRFSSASTSVRPMFCSWSVSRTSEASGSLIFVAGEPQRLREAQAGLERHDEEVDQVGKARARSGRGASAPASRRSSSAGTTRSTIAAIVPATTEPGPHAAEPAERRPRGRRRRRRRDTGCRGAARASSCTCRPR